LPARLSFARLEQGLKPALSQQWTIDESAPPLDEPRWRAKLLERSILGEGYFEGGASPLWCVHGPSGRIETVDGEAPEGSWITLVNTSVAHLAETLLVLRQWVEGLGGTRESRATQCAHLRSALRRVDPDASEGNHWAHFVDWVESNEFEIIFSVS
jgi:hypothetical protein